MNPGMERLLVEACRDQRVGGPLLSRTLGEVEAVLGEDFYEEEFPGGLRRDYGLLELSFVRVDEWRCNAVTLELHRLTYDLEPGPGPLLEEYGPYPKSVSYEKLLTVLRKAGVLLTPLPPVLDQERMGVNGTTTVVNALPDEDTGELAVWSIDFWAGLFPDPHVVDLIDRDLFVQGVLASVPEAEPEVLEHLREEGDVMLHLLLPDLLRLAVQFFHADELDASQRLLNCIAEALERGDQYVKNAVQISFIEHVGAFPGETPEFLASWPAALTKERVEQAPARCPAPPAS